MTSRIILVTSILFNPLAGGEPLVRADSPPAAPGPRVIRPALSDAVAQYRRTSTKCRPPLRGFRAPILTDAERPWPIFRPDASAPREIRDAAAYVATHLARDRLLFTLASVLQTLGPAAFSTGGTAGMDLLRSVGLPADLLQDFALEGINPPSGSALVAEILRRLTAGESPDQLRPWLDAARFVFKKSRADYAVATESGEREPAIVQLELPSAAYWRGPGDGSGVDIARQMATNIPGARLLVCIQEKDVAAFESLANSWPGSAAARMTILPSPVPVSQWAQDNCKPGTVGSKEKGDLRAACLVPRYASLGEESTIFEPGESFIADSLAAAGIVVIQSPLIFQGGDLLPVRDPSSGRRILFVGEAEIARNTALGLTAEQALEAFRIELGVDQCVVLPAASFHIDYEVTVRALGNRLLAFVNDDASASRVILETAIEPLTQAGVFDSASARSIRELLASRKTAEAVNLVAGPVMKRADTNGVYPQSIAGAFSSNPQDDPIGNFQRFLLALDILSTAMLSPQEMPSSGPVAAYVHAIARRVEDRRLLQERLVAAGCTVVPIPSLADEDRSINYINGVHATGRYFMPAYGGLYSPLDRSAAEAFSKALGSEIAVIPITCAESQRRLGALHCSVAVYPTP